MTIDGANESESELLGPGKIIVMFHGEVVKQQQESFDFFVNTVKVGQEYYLTVDPSEVFEVYDLVDGVALSTEKVEVAPPASEEPSESEKAPAVSEKESENAGNKNEQPESQVSPLVIATVVVVLVAVAGAVVMVMKRKKD
jgi:hypothetical protein